MKYLLLILLCVQNAFNIVNVNGTLQTRDNDEGGSKYFPTDFSFGVATSAYQIEGAWNEDGKGPSIWDTFTHEHPEMIDDLSSGDVACDSYHRFDQDLQALKELKVQHYRFSISWARIFPTGDVSSKNQKGIDYYNMVIDKLLANGIKPMVTMVHYDIPEELNKFGGFTNELFIKYFVAYADRLYSLYGDRVKVWITFNEPVDYCRPGYAKGNFPPRIQAPGVLDYLCFYTTINAHAAAYRHYKRHYFHKQQGKVGITINSPFYFSKNNDTELVDRAIQYRLGWLAHPLYSAEGNYPDIIIEDVNRNSAKEGRPWSRLKPITDSSLEVLKGAADFLGLNYYTSRYVEKAVMSEQIEPSWEYDASMEFSIDPKWKRGKSDWLYWVPEGMESMLKWIRDNYNNVEVIITENGWSDSGELNDPQRLEYLKAHLQEVLNAVNSGCNVSGYTYWSLIDNFEWIRGYTENFGLYYVNMTSSNKDRIAKASAKYYRNVISTRKIDAVN